ncbi:MAG: universal stress protein [Kordiimonadaceae bacterium]|nr:universal stress protein [Kordiimonadaceae bacterium]MBO6568405.1 universal stress protein [Kordiimonadaceae bacterium]MBO6963866.1 universal stress protein [Kordiimonadaceae bacterium]
MVEEIHGPIRPVAKRHRKLVVVVDDSPESKVAIRFAAARAVHITGGGLILFHCIRPGEFQHWMAVADRMREEAFEEAEELLSGIAQQLNDYCGVEPDIVVSEGEPADEMIKYLESRDDIFGLVLGAGEEAGRPGPLVDYFTGAAVSGLPCPVFIVPGTMTYEQVDAMA